MLDPLSLAGLTLAVFDELLKLGKTTAEVISDMRSFDEVLLSLQRIQHNHLLTAARMSCIRRKRFGSRSGGWMG